MTAKAYAGTRYKPIIALVGKSAGIVIIQVQEVSLRVGIMLACVDYLIALSIASSDQCAGIHSLARTRTAFW